MNNNDTITTEVEQTIENAPRDYYDLKVDSDLEFPAPTWAGRAAWRLDFEEDLEDILGERYRDYSIPALVKYMKDEMTLVGNYYLEPVGAGEEWFWVIIERFNYSTDALRWVEQNDLFDTLENEGLTVSNGWTCQWHTKHGVRVLFEGEEATLDFENLEVERDGERREIWAYDQGEGFVVYFSAMEAMDEMEENIGYQFMDSLGSCWC